MTNNILNYWPSEYEPRKSQIEVLQWMESLPSHVKYIIAEMPIGTGKSFIGMNLSGYLADGNGDAFILTPQKILQKQYQDTFDTSMLFSLYGKANYKCEQKNTNCDIGSDIKPKCASCPHRNALNIARKSPNVVLNYTLGLLVFMLSNELNIGKRKLIVFDECHTLEHHLTEFKALQIGVRRCNQFKVNFVVPETEQKAIEWMHDTYLPAVKVEYLKLKQLSEDIESRYEAGEAMDKADADVFNKLKDVVSHIGAINEYLALTPDELLLKYVLIKDKTYFKFKPLYGKDLFVKYIKPMADRFLFMSSTILNKDEFCKDLGIPLEESAFISIDSEFELDNRPVLYKPVMKMTYGWDKPDKKNERKTMISNIIEICKAHGEDSGIIHTGSFQIADWLISELQGKIPQKIYHHGPDAEQSRDAVIDEFVKNNNAEPAILISPSITEGLDLKDDKGRFAIIAKVPYPSLADAWVKRRQDLSKEWYSRQAMIGIIQGTGRIVRSKEDWGYTYILDASYGSLHKMYSKYIPHWFKDSIVT